MAKKKNTSEEKKKRRIKSLFTVRNILILAVAALFLVQYFQIQSMFGTFSFLQGRDTSLLTEIGQIKEAYTHFGDDLNEIRDYFGMETRNYIGFDEPENEDVEGDKNENEIQLALFGYIDYLSSEKNKEESLERDRLLLEVLTNNEEFLTFLSEQELNISALNEDEHGYSLYISDNEGRTLVAYNLSKDDGEFLMKTVKSDEGVTCGTAEEFQSKLKTYLEVEKESLQKAYDDVEAKKDEIETAIDSQETQDVLADLSIALTKDFTEEGSKIIYSVYSQTDNLIGEVILNTSNLEISLIDKNDQSLSVTATDISTALVPFLEKLDTKTFIEKKVEEAKAELEGTIADEGFKLLLSQSGFSISEEIREDEDRYYYDILDEEGNVISSFAVEKFTGVINIVQPDGTNSENLLFFEPGGNLTSPDIPDVIPDYGDQNLSDDDSFNILISGKHGNLVDTMIFAHIDEEKREIRMISIPRDLYYNGRKINSFAYYYGMPELKRVLSDMTGYELDKYILIDMYAFIDVIDLIGGIDIHLDNAVIDPTYRTVDSGVVGTLHYEPGDYHLGGKEALRLARSRHTSSDFARAERQQLILEALQDKAKNFGFGDADTIYEIAKVVLSKTETDIGLDEAITYYFKYQNYNIVSNNVMSSGNVLYVPPYITVENCNRLMAEAAAAGQPDPGCSGQNHAYTLLPRNNNWNIVKWYFRENFENV